MLSNDWQMWIAERIVRGSSEDEIVSKLVAAGTARQVASDAVREAASSPFVPIVQQWMRRVAKRDWLLRNHARLEALSGVDRSVPLINKPAPSAFFSEYYFLNRPVVLSGLIDDWPALKLWSLDYLAERCGNPQVEMQSRRSSTPNYEAQWETLRQMQGWSALLDYLRVDPTSNDLYLTGRNDRHNRKALAALWQDVGELPGILSGHSADQCALWLGPRGTITPWHHDLNNSLLVQIRGWKLVTLASPSQTPRMQNLQHCYSLFNGKTDFDADRPDFAPSTVRLLLEPGQILFIPVGWWHHVESLQLSISLSFDNFVEDNDFSSDYDCYGPV